MDSACNFSKLLLPKEAADSYYMKNIRHQVDDFIYIDPVWYKQIFDPTTFYILGPKGSGKTLYATYMCADIRNDTISKYHKISVDDYGKIIEMKNSGYLSFTDYSTIWKVILLQKLLCSVDKSDFSFGGRTKNFKVIQNTLLEYFGYDVTRDDFNPVKEIDSRGKQIEISNYLNSELDTKITPTKKLANTFALKNGTDEKIAENTHNTTETTRALYTDTWLQSIDVFKRTLERISFKYNHFLFVDGLDVRPMEYSANEYGECIGALIRAIYELNTQVFGSMDRKNDRTFKIIALTRTDIFLNSNLVNVTSCINDNCVELDWTYSNENEFLYSNLYKMMNRVLGWDGKSPEMPVQKFFGFQIEQTNGRTISAALWLQRLSRLRPRDIVVLLNYIQKECLARGRDNPDQSIIYSSNVIGKYSRYYMDQVKSEMQFSFSNAEIDQVFDMLKTLKKARFSENEFIYMFNNFCNVHHAFRKRFEKHRKLIDVLYSLDVLGWVEFYEQYGKTITKTHWHYREIKAVDEHHSLPWLIFDEAPPVPKFVIHNGATKYLLGKFNK